VGEGVRPKREEGCQSFAARAMRGKFRVPGLREGKTSDIGLHTKRDQLRERIVKKRGRVAKYERTRDSYGEVVDAGKRG